MGKPEVAAALQRLLVELLRDVPGEAVARQLDHGEVEDRIGLPGSVGVVKRRIARWWPLVAAAAAGTIGLVVRSAAPDPLPGEIAYVRLLQRFGEPVPSLAELVRLTTSTEAALIIVAVAAPWLLWCSRARGAFVIAVVLAAMLVVQPALKEAVDRPRPSEDQVEVRADHTSMSFPSGHSMSTTVVWATAAGLACQRRRFDLAGAVSVPIVLTFVSSGVQGVHWPTDAIAGTLFGAAFAGVALRVLPRRLVATPEHGGAPPRPP